MSDAKRHKRRWLKPVIAIAVVLLALVGWQAIPYVIPFETLFRWSKSDLDAYAADVMKSGPTALSNPPSKLGWFHVVKMQPLPHGFLLQHDSCNPFDWQGIAYSEVPLPREEKDSKGDVYQLNTPLGGNWYDVFRP